MEYKVTEVKYENKSYYHSIIADDCELVVAVSKHFCERVDKRLAFLGIFSNEGICKYVMDAIFGSGMGDYILWEVPYDNETRNFLVLDKMNDLIYVLRKKGDEIIVKTSLSSNKRIIAYDPGDILLCVDRSGDVHETSEKEEPRFVCKY